MQLIERVDEQLPTKQVDVHKGIFFYCPDDFDISFALETLTKPTLLVFCA